MLTVREFKMAGKILTVERSIRIKDLSEMFGVSERSIKYDLDNIRDFFSTINITISSQSNKGIWVDCSEEDKTRAISILSKMQSENLYYNQEMWVQKILLHLFSKDSFTTAIELANELNVNRNTIFSDLDYIDIIFQNSDIGLIRKSRQGFKLEGSENKLRGFFENMLQKNLSVYDVYMITESIKSGLAKEAYEVGLPDFFDEYYKYIYKGLNVAYQANNNLLMKENIILMIIRALISITRAKMGMLIGRDFVLKNHAESIHYLYPIWADIFRLCGLTAYEDEIIYINGEYESHFAQVDIGDLTEDLINYLSQKSSIPYSEDTTLYSRLLSHLTLSLQDSKADIKENPFNATIVENHKPMFNDVKLVCEKYLKNTPLIFNESFISYIVLHFLVSQRNLAKSKKFKAILVCATGRGAAKIIEKIIESEISELEILANCSLVEVETVVDKLNPDYIISVFPVKSHVPVIVVEPIPTKEDLRFIKKIIYDRLDKDILHDSTFSSILRFDENSNTAEEISQEIIILGLNIYNKFLQNKQYRIKAELDFAFITHIMLFANRYYFKSQFREVKEEQPEPIEMNIKKMLQDIDVHISSGEVKALLNYFII